MSGQSGGRGYLVQALTSVLDALANDHDWTAIALEPNLTTDKVDIFWQYPTRCKVVQVKSSQNPIKVPDAKKWCAELEDSIQADEYELRLIGPVSEGVTALGTHGRVVIPTPRPLDPEGLVKHAAQNLDWYLRARNFGAVTPATREMIVQALITQFSTFATRGRPIERETFDGILRAWIGSPALQQSPLFKTHNAYFHFIGDDAGGGQSGSKKENARWVSYVFKLEVLHRGYETLNLMDLQLNFARFGEVVHSQIPMTETEEVTTLSVPSQKWYSLQFTGIVMKDMPLVVDCDEIFLTAKSTEGDLFRVSVATGIIES